MNAMQKCCCIRQTAVRLLATEAKKAPQPPTKKEEPVKAGKKTHGNLPDHERIFSNLYRDEDPFIKGALKRVCNKENKKRYRVIGIEPKTSSHVHKTLL